MLDRIQNIPQSQPKIRSTPRQQYTRVHGRKMNKWRFELGQKTGLFKNDTKDETLPEMYKLDDSLKTMTSRLAKV